MWLLIVWIISHNIYVVANNGLSETTLTAEHDGDPSGEARVWR
jgi:hypothetical protein